ncbi:hypothetical protein GMLC_36440 [Geomonas limicola]|uniref:Lipoprotein n=1 Tax=Geomonas limicola TaxID=2740186 RepID=A0A6V8NBR5_9BACT|nr:hypothetical protein [Geomonas limicola]GFO70065.1 hypothetical protein GMLC_36440 [Geomonas limicola]
MNLRTLIGFLLLAFGLSAAGCSDYHDGAAQQQPTRISGIASKGIFTSGTVNLYALVNGKRGALLKQAAINPAFGTYSANLGNYVGPVVAEASGDYLDEATGSVLQVPADAPIRAALPKAQGDMNLPVTALTEIAVQKTGGAYTPQAIQAANDVVSDLFKVDIINTQPVAARAADLNSASADQATYTLALAVISQLRDNGSQSLASTLADLASNIDVATSSMNSGTADALKGALSDFTGNVHNETGVTDASNSPLANVGTRTVLVTVSVPGSAQLGGVQGTVTMPAGVTLNQGSPALTGGAVGTILASNPSAGALTVGLLSSTGFASGNILTFTCSVPSAQPVPTAADFTLSQVKVLDANRNLLSAGLSLAVTTLSSFNSSTSQSFTVTLSVPNGLALLGGVQGTVSLPTGFTLNPGSTTLTGAAVGSLLETNPGSGSFVFGIASGTGFSSGSFLTFTCSRATAGSAPDAGSFAVTGVKILSSAGTELPAQVTVTVN